MVNLWAAAHVAAAAPATLLPDLNARLHPSDATPWTILFVLTLITVLPAILVADYSSGTVNTAQAVTDTEALGTALNFVSQQRVTIDNSITQLTSASDAVTSDQTQLTTAQTNLMQADVGTVSTQLSLSE